MNDYYIYMLTNKSNRVLYTGITNNLQRRLIEHKNNNLVSFVTKYHAHKLVYFEHCNNVNDAICREKEIKGWLRKKKNALIETMNPDWADLSDEILWG